MPWRDSIDAASQLEACLRDPAAAGGSSARNLMAAVLLAAVDAFAALLTPRGEVLDISSAALRHSGLDPSDVIGRPLWQVPVWLTPADAEAVHRAVGAGAEGRHVDVVVGLAPLLGSAAFRAPLEVRPIRTNTGAVAFVLAQAPWQGPATVSVDLEAGADDVPLTLQITRQLEFRQRLVTDVRHDLGSPLQSIVARAGRLLGSEDQAVRQEARELRAAALAIMSELTELDDLTSLEHRRTQLRLTDCDLSEVVFSVAMRFEPVAMAARRSFVIQMPATLRAKVDRDKLTRIVANLVGNAIRYTDEGGRVRCTLYNEDRNIVFEVGDSGPGIAPKHRRSIFGRAWRAPSVEGKVSGSGLGLSIVRDMVRLHGGTIEVGEAPEGGALLVVRLPYVEAWGHATNGSLKDETARALLTETVIADVERHLGSRADRP